MFCPPTAAAVFLLLFKQAAIRVAFSHLAVSKAPELSLSDGRSDQPFNSFRPFGGHE